MDNYAKGLRLWQDVALFGKIVAGCRKNVAGFGKIVVPFCACIFMQIEGRSRVIIF
jgi:hypothetical protein